MTKTTVGVWGVGTVGSALVQLIAKNPDLELVAGLAYNPDKFGKDVGELAGAEHLGVPAVSSAQEIIDAKPDVVIYSARDTGDYATDDDLILLLESGINTITPLPYSNLKVRGAEVEQRFISAAEKGGVTFMATGPDPDFFWERQVLTLTGLCGEVSSIRNKVIFRGDAIGEHMLPLHGFGRPVEEARKDTDFNALVYNYFAPSMKWACAHMGHELDEVTIRTVSEATTERIVHPMITIEPGTVGIAASRLEGWIDGKVFASQEMIYHMGVNRPPEAPTDECWIIDIEGKPSLRVVIQAMASVEDGTDRYPDDPKQIAPGYWLSSGPLIRAIPIALAADPGVKETVPPELHYIAPSS